MGSDDTTDKKFIAFGILYPDYIPHLARKGLHNFLTTQWAKSFWQKLFLQNFEEIFQGLNDEEKAFWQTTLDDPHMFAGEDLAEHWESMCAWIDKQQREMARKDLMQRLDAAAKAGDAAEVKNVQMAISALIAPSREEE